MTLNKKFTSIIDELNDYVPNKGREYFIEDRAEKIIASINNLKSLINDSYEPEIAEELIKRLHNAVKSGDEKKITRKLREMRENDKKGQ